MFKIPSEKLAEKRGVEKSKCTIKGQKILKALTIDSLSQVSGCFPSPVGLVVSWYLLCRLPVLFDTITSPLHAEQSQTSPSSPCYKTNVFMLVDFSAKKKKTANSFVLRKAIWYVNTLSDMCLFTRARSYAASLRYQNWAEITVLV